MLSFAVGSLLGDVFCHLLPEVWNNVDKGHFLCLPVCRPACLVVSVRICWLVLSVMVLCLDLLVVLSVMVLCLDLLVVLSVMVLCLDLLVCVVCRGLCVWICWLVLSIMVLCLDLLACVVCHGSVF